MIAQVEPVATGFRICFFSYPNVLYYQNSTHVMYLKCVKVKERKHTYDHSYVRFGGKIHRKKRETHVRSLVHVFPVVA